MSKPKVIKDYDKLNPDILAQIKLEYPNGFEKRLIKFTNHEGKLVSALPFETEDRQYLIRMTRTEAQEIIEDDDDYDDDGLLTDKAKERMEDELDEDIGVDEEYNDDDDNADEDVD